MNTLTQTLTHCHRVKFRLTCILIYSSPNLVRYIRLLQMKMFFKIKEEAFTVLHLNIFVPKFSSVYKIITNENVFQNQGGSVYSIK